MYKIRIGPMRITYKRINTYNWSPCIFDINRNENAVMRFNKPVVKSFKNAFQNAVTNL